MPRAESPSAHTSTCSVSIHVYTNLWMRAHFSFCTPCRCSEDRTLLPRGSARGRKRRRLHSSVNQGVSNSSPSLFATQHSVHTFISPEFACGMRVSAQHVHDSLPSEIARGSVFRILVCTSVLYSCEHADSGFCDCAAWVHM